MDSRISKYNLAELSRKIVFICLGSLGSNTQYIEAVHTALVRHRALLTAEPEPCEDAEKLRAIIRKPLARMYNGIFADETKSAIEALDSLISATKVSDKRVEEFRAQVERLRQAGKDLANAISAEDWARSCDRMKEALAATEPKP